MWLQIILSIFIAYLIGSIPSAYILVRWFYKQDITGEGSGNVGTLNVFRTTKSKALAFVVLVIDFSKGLIVILLAKHFYFDQPIIYSFPISCFLGVAIAVIPAIIFMFRATKKKKK